MMYIQRTQDEAIRDRLKYPCRSCKSFDHIKYKLSPFGLHTLYCSETDCISQNYGVSVYGSTPKEMIDNWNEVNKPSEDDSVTITLKKSKFHTTREELDTLWGHLNGHAELLKGILEKLSELENPDE